jgi:putative aminopeptidase FrvX
LRRTVQSDAGTRLAGVQAAASGSAAAVLGIPCGYWNTPSSMVDLQDLDAAVHLLALALSRGFVLS